MRLRSTMLAALLACAALTAAAWCQAATYPRLPALDTTTVLYTSPTVTGTDYGLTWNKLIPLAEWREYVPTLPAGEWAMIQSSDHVTNSIGRWYMSPSADSILELTGTPTLIWPPSLVANDQCEMPGLVLNKYHGVIEVYPHVQGVDLRGLGQEQDALRYWTVDLQNFYPATTALPSGKYLSDSPYLLPKGINGHIYWSHHNGYPWFVQGDDDRTYMTASYIGGEANLGAIIVRDSDDGEWYFDGQIVPGSCQYVTGGELDTYMIGCWPFKYMGQWYRIGIVGTRPRLDSSGVIGYGAVPIAGPHDITPLGGMFMLATPSSGYAISASPDIYWDEKAGTLYLVVTERNTTTSLNRCVVHSNSVPCYTPIPTSQATYTPPATTIFDDGSIVPQFTIDEYYEHGDLTAAPPNSSFSNTNGSGTIATTVNGYTVTSSGNDVTQNLGSTIDTSTKDVVIARWKGLRWGTITNSNALLGLRSDNSNTNAQILFLQYSSLNDRQWTSYLQKRSGATTYGEVGAFLWTNTDSRGETTCWHRHGVDLDWIVFDQGAKEIIYIDGQPGLYREIASGLGSVNPFYKLGIANMSVSWEGFSWASGTYTDTPLVDAMATRRIVRDELRRNNNYLRIESKTALSTISTNAATAASTTEALSTAVAALPTAAAIRTEIDSNSTQLSAIATDAAAASAANTEVLQLIDRTPEISDELIWLVKRKDGDEQGSHTIPIKATTGDLLVCADFGSILGTNELVVSVDSITVVGGTGLTVSSASDEDVEILSGRYVTLRISDGVAADDAYKVRLEVTTNTPNTFSPDLPVRVRE